MGILQWSGAMERALESRFGTDGRCDCHKDGKARQAVPAKQTCETTAHSVAERGRRSPMPATAVFAGSAGMRNARNAVQPGRSTVIANVWPSRSAA